MTDLLPFLITGVTAGSVYALAAMGLVLTYRTSGIFNFAHGALAAAGAYAMNELWQERGLPWPIAALLAVLIAGVGGGLVLERVAVRLSTAPTANRVVATLGTLIALQGLLVVRYGAAGQFMPYFLPTSLVRFGGVNIRYEQIIVVLLGLLAAVSLYAFFRYLRIGLAMQAVVDDPSLLSLQSTNPTRVRRTAWIVGCCFAAASGLLLGPTLGLDAAILTLLVVQAFGAAAIGRFHSLVGTYVGGLAIGLLQELTKKYVTSPSLSSLPSALPFLVLFVVLLVVPRTKLVERGTRVVKRSLPPLPPPRNVAIAVTAIGTVLALSIPQLAPTRLPLYTTAAAFTILFISLSLLVRTSGQVSLCHMAFAAVGAATFVHAHDVGLPWPIAVLAGGIVAVPIGAFVAIPAIRLSGVYLAIATFGFGIIVEQIFYRTFLLFGATRAVTAPRPGFASGDTPYYYVVLALAAAACMVPLAVRRGRLGRLLRGLADSPTALSAHGIDTNVTRVLAFSISAFLAGIAGAILGPITGSATGGTFAFSTSLILVAVLYASGRRPVLSAIVASLLYIVVPGYIENANVVEWFPIMFGVVAVLVATDTGGLVRDLTIRSKRMAERTTERTRLRARVEEQELWSQ